MGESFMGFPNRLRAFGSQPTDFRSSSGLAPEIDTSYDPNHALSSYYGYLLSKNYLNRLGGMEFCMQGDFYTWDVLPAIGYTSGGHKPSIGSEQNPYYCVYAEEIHGSASSASALTEARTIKVSLKKTSSDRQYSGEAEFDGSKDIEIEVWTPFLHINGGTVNGDTTFGGTITCNNGAIINGNTLTNDIYPVMPTHPMGSTIVGTISSYKVGQPNRQYLAMYAKEFYGSLVGNAESATKFNIPVKITVDVNSSYTNKGSAILEGTEGDGIHYPESVLDENKSLYQGITIKTAASGYLPLTGGTLTGNFSVGGKVSGKFTGEQSTTYTVHDETHGDYLAYSSLGFYLDIPHIKTYPQKGSFVVIDRYGDPINDSDTGTSGQTIDAYIDDLATDAIVAAAGCMPDGVGVHKDINMYANALTVCELQNEYYDKGWHISKYATKGSGLRRGAIISGSTVSNIICAGKPDENIIYPAEYDYWTTNPTSGYKSKSTLSNYCNSNKRYIDVFSRFVCFRSYIGDPIYDKSSSYSKSNGDGTYSGKGSHSMFGSGSPVFNAHREGADDLWTGVEIYSGYNDSTAHVYVAGKIKALGTTSSTYDTLSDIRHKTDIEVLDKISSIHNISKVTPVSYIKNDKKEIGMVAQQVKESLYDDNQSSYYCSHDDECDYLTLNYPAFIPDLINTCQYLLGKVDNLEVIAGLKDSLEFPDLQKENTFDEDHYRKNAKKIADM